MTSAVAQRSSTWVRSPGVAWTHGNPARRRCSSRSNPRSGRAQVADAVGDELVQRRLRRIPVAVAVTVQMGGASRERLPENRDLIAGLGRGGGGAGAPGRCHLPGAGKLRVKGRGVVPPGHRIVMATPGVGGPGDPCRRARERVRGDVLHGYVTVEAAERDHGLREDDS